MRLLIDTQLLVWSLVEPARMPQNARSILDEPGHDFVFSAVSIWEVAIKYALKRPDFTLPPERIYKALVDTGYRELPITSSAAARVATLPLHHRDPFDRLLVAQATDEGALLLTADAVLAAYAPHIMMAG